jgi:hypothetical protein
MKYITGYILTSFLILLLIGCNSVHKTTNAIKESIDSSHVAASESAQVSKRDSMSSKTEAGGYERETVYHFDTVYQVVKGDTVLRYVPRIVKVYEKGNYTSAETTARHDSDSNTARRKDSTVLAKKTEAKQTDKQSSRVPAALIIGAIVAIGAVVVIGNLNNWSFKI